MKKLIFILLAAAAFSCGDGTNRSSERENEGTDVNNREELIEPDTTGMTDTTSNGNTDGEELQRDSIQ